MVRFGHHLRFPELGKVSVLTSEVEFVLGAFSAVQVDVINGLLTNLKVKLQLTA